MSLANTELTEITTATQTEKAGINATLALIDAFLAAP